MAQKKITDLQTISTLTGSEYIPVDDSLQTYKATMSQLYDYMRTRFKGSYKTMENIQLTVSVGSSAMTIALKTNAGTDASSTDKGFVAFRSATATAGTFTMREISSALSLVVSSGSTLGTTSGVAYNLYVYLIDTGSAAVLGVSRSLLNDNVVASSTAEGGAGGADSAGVMYSTAAQTSKPIRLLAKMVVNQATAGTWASVPTDIGLIEMGAALAASGDSGQLPISAGNTGFSFLSFATGTWTPTGTNVSNMASTSGGFGTYVRIGSYVIWAFTLTIAQTAANTATTLRVNLPVASNFGAVTDASGSGSNGDGSINGCACRVAADVSNDAFSVTLRADTTGGQIYSFSGSYQII